MKPSTGHIVSNLIYAHMWLLWVPLQTCCLSFSWGMIRNIQCIPYNKKARGSLLAFIFYEWAGDNQSLWGCRISQLLWQIENHSASLCYVTHLRCWQENEEIKDFPFVRRLLLFFYVRLQHNRMELLIHKCSQWSRRRITETIETMFKSENHFFQECIDTFHTASVQI